MSSSLFRLELNQDQNASPAMALGAQQPNSSSSSSSSSASAHSHHSHQPRRHTTVASALLPPSPIAAPISTGVVQLLTGGSSSSHSHSSGHPQKVNSPPTLDIPASHDQLQQHLNRGVPSRSVPSREISQSVSVSSTNSGTTSSHSPQQPHSNHSSTSSLHHNGNGHHAPATVPRLAKPTRAPPPALKVNLSSPRASSQSVVSPSPNSASGSSRGTPTVTMSPTVGNIKSTRPRGRRIQGMSLDTKDLNSFVLSPVARGTSASLAVSTMMSSPRNALASGPLSPRRATHAHPSNHGGLSSPTPKSPQPKSPTPLSPTPRSPKVIIKDRSPRPPSMTVTSPKRINTNNANNLMAIQEGQTPVQTPLSPRSAKSAQHESPALKPAGSPKVKPSGSPKTKPSGSPKTKPSGSPKTKPHSSPKTKPAALVVPSSVTSPSAISPRGAEKNFFQAGRTQPPPIPAHLQTPTNAGHTRKPSGSLPSKLSSPPPIPHSHSMSISMFNSPITPRSMPPPIPASHRSTISIASTPQHATSPMHPSIAIDSPMNNRSSSSNGSGGSSTNNNTPSHASSPSTTAASTSATRSKIECEILNTEANYLSNLQHFVSNFLAPLRQKLKSTKKEDHISGLTEEALNRIANNIETIASFHASFYAELMKEYTRVQKLNTQGVMTTPLKNPMFKKSASTGEDASSATPTAASTGPTYHHPDFARIFSANSAYFKLYCAYLNSYETCVRQMDELRENEKFQTFVKIFMIQPRKATTLVISTNNGNGAQQQPQYTSMNVGRFSGISPGRAASNTVSVTSTTPKHSNTNRDHVMDFQQQPSQQQLQQQQAAATQQQPSLSPNDLMIQPVQRLPRYVLLLKELLRHAPNPEDQTSIQLALSNMESVTLFVNERKRNVENIQHMLAISTKIRGELPKEITLIEPHRRLIREGILDLIFQRTLLGMNLFGTSVDQGCKVRLFNDLIIITSNGEKYKGYIDLNSAGITMTSSGLNNGTASGNSSAASTPSHSHHETSQQQDSFILSDAKSTHATTFRASSAEEAYAWYQQIEASIQQLQQEKQVTIRRQRVLAARTVRTPATSQKKKKKSRAQLKTLMSDNIFSPISLGGPLAKGDESGEEETNGGVMSARAAASSDEEEEDDGHEEVDLDALMYQDPQLQESWLEKESQAMKQRQRRNQSVMSSPKLSSQASLAKRMQSMDLSSGGHALSSPKSILPKELIAQLKIQQKQLKAEYAGKPQPKTSVSVSSNSSSHSTNSQSTSSVSSHSLPSSNRGSANNIQTQQQQQQAPLQQPMLVSQNSGNASYNNSTSTPARPPLPSALPPPPPSQQQQAQLQQKTTVPDVSSTCTSGTASTCTTANNSAVNSAANSAATSRLPSRRTSFNSLNRAGAANGKDSHNRRKSSMSQSNLSVSWEEDEPPPGPPMLLDDDSEFSVPPPPPPPIEA